MTKKYKLTEELVLKFGFNLFRIEALVEFTTTTGIIVKAGEKGGFVQSESNLCQDGTGWVFNGEMYGGVMHGGEMHGGEMHGGVMWDGVMHGGEMWGGVMYGGEMHGGEMWGGVMYGGEMHGGEMWGGEMYGGEMHGGEMHGGVMWGGDVVSRNPVFLAGGFWNITITDNHITIGCQHHLITEWQSFGDNEIAKMDSKALDWWKKWKDFIFQAIELSK